MNRFPRLSHCATPLLVALIVLTASGRVFAQATAAPVAQQPAQPQDTTPPQDGPQPSESATPPPPASPPTTPTDGAPAQPVQNPDKPAPPDRHETEVPGVSETPESLQARITQLESATGTAEPVRTELIALYRQAIDQLGILATWTAKINEFEDGRLDAPDDLERLRNELADINQQAAAPATTTPTADVPLADLARTLDEAEIDLTTAQKKTRDLADIAQQRSDRRTAIPNLIAAATLRLEETNRELPATADAQLTEARALVARLTKRAIEQELRSYDEELRNYAARSEILTVRREITRLWLSRATAKATALREAVAAARSAEAEKQRRDAQAEQRAALPAFRELAKRNTVMATRRIEVAALILNTRDQIKTVNQYYRQLDRDLTFIQNIFSSDATGATAGSVGPFLRKQRTLINSLQSFAVGFEKVKQEAAELKIALYDYKEQKVDLADIEAEVANEIASLEREHPVLPVSLSDAASGLLSEGLRVSLTAARQAQVRQLLENRRTILDSLIKDSETYEEELTKLVKAEIELFARTATFKQHIDRYVLWLPSASPLTQMKLPRKTWISTATWIGMRDAMVADFWRLAPTYFAVTIAVIGLLGLGRRFRNEVGEISGRASRARSDSYSLTIKVLLLTILRTLPIPLALIFLAWRVQACATTDVYTLAQGLRSGLLAVGLFLAVVMFADYCCRPRGLADSHYRWEGKSLKLFRLRLRMLAVVMVPTLLVVAFTERYVEDSWRESIGRISLITALLATAWTAAALLRPNHGLFALRIGRNKQTWLYRARHLLFAVAAGGPLALVLASAIGYHYTAIVFGERMMFTLALWWLMLLINGLMVRYVFVAQRHLALEQARKQAAAAAADGSTPGEPTIDESRLDLVTIGDQTRKMMRAFSVFAAAIGLWFIWIDILPALGFLDDIRWEYAFSGNGAAPAGGEGTAATGNGPAIGYISLKHVLLAVLSLVVTYVMAGNIPGLLEITLLKHLPLDKGGRFAVTALARYVIVVIGIVVSFGIVGIGWSNVQWLVTAMVVGLGFGLQEIFANFVSGIMLLFERPLRVGDVVTVGNVTGTVTQIRIRATTITDWDRKELIIPNREFVTGSFINWSLSDSLLRLTFPIGVAYGSDVALVEKTMLDVARSYPDVLTEPPPRVVFWEFGDSSLNFRLQVFITSTDHLVPTRNAMHKGIDAGFRAAGIVIPFPQRDVHHFSGDGKVAVDIASAPTD